jgi:DNA processing protein
MSPQDLLYEIALTRVPNIGVRLAKVLIAHCRGAQAVFEESKKNLLKINGIGPRHAESISQSDTLHEAEANIKFLIDHNCQVSYYLHDDTYPQRLLQYDDAPVLLYYRGTSNLNETRTVGIVGTRKPNNYGKAQTVQIVEALQHLNVQIISGLAYGIDSIAHQSSVAHLIDNIAVMATGLDNIYPAQNRKLAQQIQEHGCILTEFPINTRPDRENFPLRNRIIAGIADAILVMQSASKGGSLITAEYANSYHKDVFALPGRVSDDMSAGCNKLIKTNKAHLMESAQDIAYIMRWDDDSLPASKQIMLFDELSEIERSIVSYLKEHEEISIDQIHHHTQLKPSELASNLLNLEFKGVIRSLPGKKYAMY